MTTRAELANGRSSAQLLLQQTFQTPANHTPDHSRESYLEPYPQIIPSIQTSRIEHLFSSHTLIICVLFFVIIILIIIVITIVIVIIIIINNYHYH